jgi:hypothetical protein
MLERVLGDFDIPLEIFQPVEHVHDDLSPMLPDPVVFDPPVGFEQVSGFQN